KILLSKRDAVLSLSLSIRTIENLIARKELIARRVGRRCLIFRRLAGGICETRPSLAGCGGARWSMMRRGRLANSRSSISRKAHELPSAVLQAIPAGLPDFPDYAQNDARGAWCL